MASINPANAVVSITHNELVRLGTRVPLMRDAAGRIVHDYRDALEPGSEPAGDRSN